MHKLGSAILILLVVVNIGLAVGQVPEGCVLASQQGGTAEDLVVSSTSSIQVGNRRISASIVGGKLADPRVRVMMGLGEDRVGGTEDLLDLARRKGAVAAINGTFFDA